jgi:PST family polysaccharide transporter
MRIDSQQQRWSVASHRYFWILLALGVKILFNFLISKQVALVFGEEGITVLMHFLNFVALLSFLPMEGVHRAWLSIAGKKPLQVNTELWVAAHFWDIAIFLVIIVVPTFFLRHFLSLFYFDALQYFGVLASILAYIFLHLFLQYFLWARSYVWYGMVNVLLSACSFLAVYWASRFGELSFVLTALVISYWLPLLLVVLMAAPPLPPLQKKWWLALYEDYQIYWQFILLALVGVLLDKLLAFEVRLWAVDTFGIIDTGYWQALVRVSELLVGMLLAFLAAAYYPMACQMPDGSSAWVYTVRQLRVAVPLVLVVMFLLWLSSEWWLALLYDAPFVRAAAWSHWQLTGDFFRMLSCWGALLLLARQSLMMYLVMQLLSVVVYLLSLASLYQLHAVEALPMAYAIEHLVYAAALYAYILWKRP